MKKNNPKHQPQKSKNTFKDKALITPQKKRSSTLHVIIAFCIPVMLYLQTINFGFTNLDDDHIIINNINFLKDFGNAPKAFLTDAFIVKSNTFSYYRPLQTLSYMVDIQLSGGNNPWMYHLTNILLLGLISCLLYLLLKRLLIPSNLALSGTLIYCVNPLFVFTVAFIPTRGELLLTFFSLLSFLFFIELLQKGKFIHLLLNWAAFTFALFCKETAALLPLLFILYFITFYNKKRLEKKYFLTIVLYAITGIFWFWLRSKAIKDFTYSGDVFGLNAILSNLRTIPEALSKFFLPFDFAPIPSFSILKTLAGLGILVIITIMIFKNNNRSRKEMLFCISWFLILMFPPMLYKHPYMDYLDHRFFLPLIGVLLFLLFIFPKKWLIKGDIKRYWLMIVVIVFLSSFTFIKSRSYSDPMTFYNSVIYHNPNFVTAYFNRGIIKSDRNDIQGAIDDYNKAIEINPNYSEAYYNRGNLKRSRGDFQGAIDDLSKAIANHPDYFKAYNNRGIAKANMNDINGAIADFDVAISINNNYAEAYNCKGVAMYSAGNLKEAVINYNKAIEINPNYLEVYINRAIAKYSLKDFKGAIDDCDNSLKIKPNDERAIKLKAQAQQELQKINH